MFSEKTIFGKFKFGKVKYIYIYIYICIERERERERSVLYHIIPGFSLGKSVIGTLEKFDLFIQTIHCNAFKQARVADTGIHKVFNSTFLYIYKTLFHNKSISPKKFVYNIYFCAAM